MSWHCNKCWPMDCNCRLKSKTLRSTSYDSPLGEVRYTFSGETI